VNHSKFRLPMTAIVLRQTDIFFRDQYAIQPHGGLSSRADSEANGLQRPHGEAGARWL
jgi:hypothetical protein